MKKVIQGKAFVLGSNIDTDQIIPAEYLVYNPEIPEDRKQLGAHALSGVPNQKSGLPLGNIPFVEKDFSQYKIIIAKDNFGCGSSREHAVSALAAAGVETVIALSFARIFYRNCISSGQIIPLETEEDITKSIKTGDEVKITLNKSDVSLETSDRVFILKPLGAIIDILQAGDIFQYWLSSQ